jgi:hypothetical protein
MAEMLPVLILALASALPSPKPHAGPSPSHEFWRNVVSHAGLQPLAASRSLRLIRSSTASTSAIVVTVSPSGEEALVDIRLVPDWRHSGASTRTRRLSQDRYEILRDLASPGLWKQVETAPTGAEGITDGVLWYVEGVRDGERYAIVRHEPKEPEGRALCAEFMSIIGEPDQAPGP